jgi:hypothetical protein
MRPDIRVVELDRCVFDLERRFVLGTVQIFSNEGAIMGYREKAIHLNETVNAIEVAIDTLATTTDMGTHVQNAIQDFAAEARDHIQLIRALCPMPSQSNTSTGLSA